jgi:myosin-5
MADQYVYVRHDEHKWVPALLVEQNNDNTEATVSVSDFENEESITGNNDSNNDPLNSNNDNGNGNTKAKAKSTLIKVQLKDYPNNSLPLQNVTEGGQMKAVADMIELGFLHEAAILYNLKHRHTRDLPYTRTGDLVIACNPYKWFPQLYTDENRTKYSRALVWEADKKDYDQRQDLSPHVYETSALAYKGLIAFNGQHQSILVSGESGAGKTETVKICMNHLASVVQSQHGAGDAGAGISGTNGTNGAAGVNGANVQQDQDVITRVVDSNPLLEAFGNAKTRRNDNSSRFGKYIQLQFDQGQGQQQGQHGSRVTLAGSTCDVYLLEKSRVVRHELEERTFHIFYQILAAPDKVKGLFWKKLKGTNYSSFSYVGPTDTQSIEGVTDADQFQHTLTSLAIVGVLGQELETLMQAICIVLQLGNVIFGPSEVGDGSGGHGSGSGHGTDGGHHDPDQSNIKSMTELTDLADLMGIPKEELETTLTQRKVNVRTDETIMVPLSVDAAKDAADALAKQIYDCIFLWLVSRINLATTATSTTTGGDTQDYGIIGLLDIFGFESFPINSFEQLCINYANEQLQAKFTKDVFTSVFEEYQLEGIALDEIKYDDNTDVLDLIQNRTGLLAMLNEECIRPNGSDYGFVNKALHANDNSPALIIPRIKRSNVEFGIRHYAGDVLYDATDFVTKNQDTLPSDLMECAQSSTNDIIRNELVHDASRNRSKHSGSRAPPRSKKSNLVAPTVWTKYKDQLQHLMSDLQHSTSRYIRCIKPNALKKPSVMQHGMTLEQLRSSGVISAVTLARSAFPNRMEHDLVLARFFPLWPPSVKRTPKENSDLDSLKRESEELLMYALKPLESDDGVKAFVVGKTRAYFRGGALEFIEAARLKGMEPAAIHIQALVRGRMGRKKAYRVKHKAEIDALQRCAGSAVTMQCALRCYVARRALKKLRKERKEKAKREKESRKRERSAVKIQSWARVWEWKEKAKREKERQTLERLAVKIQSWARVWGARKQRDVRYVQFIKRQAKLLKKDKKMRKLVKAATIIQKMERRVAVKKKYGAVLLKSKDRLALREKLNKIKRKIAKSEKLRKRELEKIEKGVESEMAGREAWEESVMASAHEVAKDEAAKVVEFLQAEYRKLQIKTKTMEGMVKPLKNNFETLMQENTELREEFAEIHKKNESIKAVNKELVDKRTAAEKKTGQFREELKTVSNRFMPIANGRLDFQKALKEILDMLEARCKDGQLFEDVTLLAYQCQADAKGLQAGVDVANEVEEMMSPRSKAKRGLGGSFSKLAKSPKSPAKAKLGKNVAHMVSPGVNKERKSSRKSTGTSLKSMPEL